MGGPAVSDDAPAAATRAGDRRARNLMDLDGLGVPELTALIEAAQAKRAEKMEGAKAALLEEFREKAAQLGVALESLLPAAAPAPSSSRGRKLRRDAGTKAMAKYRGPNGEGWSGRGRLPRWLQALEAEGRRRDEFRI